jgi:tetratricopeptide (TPR) repeat protein
MSAARQFFEAGIAALRADKLDEALRALGAALERAPHDAEFQSLYGLALTRAGRRAEAAPWLKGAVQAEPGQMGFRLNLSEHYERGGEDANAVRELRLIALREPHWAHVWPRLIAALTRGRNWRELAEAGAAWLRVKPGNDAALSAVARGKYESGDVSGALEAYRLRRQHNPSSVEAHCSYGLCCLAAGAFAEAADALDEAERLEPNDVDTLAGKARLLTYLGRFTEAEAYCRRCLTLDPEHMDAHTFLSQLNKGRLGEAEKEVLTRLAGDPGRALNQRIAATFALARRHDSEGDADAAFRDYAAANALARERARRDGLIYAAAENEARTRLIMARAANHGPRCEPHGRPMPVFIVGMPRSGTTLVEAVLSAHSQVCGKGELSGLRLILQNWLTQTHVDAAQMDAWARQYLSSAMPAPDAALFTDKMPMNFEAAGLIDRLFPGAPIVDVRRNALETGFSIFRQGLTKFFTFANRLEDIAHAYGQYARLMAHWRRSGVRITTIQYEDFVANFDEAAPNLVRACGLEWEERCRDFQNAPRAISTYSTVQVREPLSLRSSAARYAHHLAPLRDALERNGVNIETGALAVES